MSQLPLMLKKPGGEQFSCRSSIGRSFLKNAAAALTSVACEQRPAPEAKDSQQVPGVRDTLPPLRPQRRPGSLP